MDKCSYVAVLGSWLLCGKALAPECHWLAAPITLRMQELKAEKPKGSKRKVFDSAGAIAMLKSFAESTVSNFKTKVGSEILSLQEA